MPDSEPAVEAGFRTGLDGIEVVGCIDQILEGPDGGRLVCDITTGAEPTRPVTR